MQKNKEIDRRKSIRQNFHLIWKLFSVLNKIYTFILLRLHLWYIIYKFCHIQCIKNWRIKNINKTIENAKVIHLMMNDKFNKRYVNFINSNFNKKDHIFLCLRRCFDDKSTPFPYASNVYEIFNFSEVTIRPKHNQRIIAHSLIDAAIVNFLCEHESILSHTFWLIWGADLYDRNDEEHVFLAQKIPYYITDVDGDGKYAAEKYKTTPKIFHSGYTFPITYPMIEKALLYKKKMAGEKRNFRIQINNSADITTLEMLHTISKFNESDIEIFTVLSYGQLQHKDNIIRTGKILFGDRFLYLEKNVTPLEYAKIVSINNILILNQNRQQGLGNSFVALAFGTKLFIRSDVTTYSFFMSNGINVFPANKIDQMSFSDLIYLSKEDIENQQLCVKKFFDDSYLAEQWNTIFEEIL